MPKHGGGLKTILLCMLSVNSVALFKETNDFNVVHLPCGALKWTFRQNVFSISFVYVSGLFAW